MQSVKVAAASSRTINVTPLVDVVLVLLIIFMVVTPMLQKGPPVTLPKALEPAEEARRQDPDPDHGQAQTRTLYDREGADADEARVRARLGGGVLSATRTPRS